MLSSRLALSSCILASARVNSERTGMAQRPTINQSPHGIGASVSEQARFGDSRVIIRDIESSESRLKTTVWERRRNEQSLL